MTPAIVARGLRKAYGQVQAVDGVDLSVEPGSIVALVGPNGSGKTTTVECIEGLRALDEGTARILGMDPVADRARLVQRVGVQLQEGSLYEKMRVGEAFWVAEPFYERTLPAAELMAIFGLDGKERAFYSALSGGQKRRLLTALAFVGDPDVAILDEPTSGLDPQARFNVWEVLRERGRRREAALLLTTHNLDEAHDYCDEVAIIDAGRILAHGAPDGLLRRHGMEQRVSFPAVAGNGGGLTEDDVRAALGVAIVQRERDRLVAYGGGHELAGAAGRLAKTAHLPAPGFELRAARLQDLFLMLTGRGYREER